MELTGKAVGASLDLDSNRFRITFEVNENEVVKAEYDRLKGYEKLKIKAVRYTQRRSLDANAYFHALAGKIADALTISKAKAKNVLICKYGQPQLLPDGSIMVYKTNAPEDFMWEQKVYMQFLLNMKKKLHFIKFIVVAIHMTRKKCLF